MRGAPAAIVGTSQVIGLIPAHAGSTTRLSQRYGSKWAHPRACGEHLPTVTVKLSVPGSSPRMRGAPSDPKRFRYKYGLIPAHAGSTYCTGVCGRYPGAHPRACGEHLEVEEVGPSLRGSSPRMRGALLPPLSPHIHLGLIPAHAGSTARSTLQELTAWAHPRACGEHRLRLSLLCCFQGSSPRMRGAPQAMQNFNNSLGLIPAHAGSTRGWPHARLRAQAHPRACGEHHRRTSPPRHIPGSSPRMRGAPSLDELVCLGAGLIPAHAGSTLRCGRLFR